MGLMISVISITGDECKLSMLSPLTELSGGDMLRVDPLRLDKDFSEIVNDAVIATDVRVKVKLHNALQFRNEDAINLIKEENSMQRDIGTVTSASEVTFEYTLKPKEELQKIANFDIGKI